MMSEFINNIEIETVRTTFLYFWKECCRLLRDLCGHSSSCVSFTSSLVSPQVHPSTIFVNIHACKAVAVLIERLRGKVGIDEQLHMASSSPINGNPFSIRAVLPVFCMEDKILKNERKRREKEK